MAAVRLGAPHTDGNIVGSIKVSLFFLIAQRLCFVFLLYFVVYVLFQTLFLDLSFRRRR